MFGLRQFSHSPARPNGEPSLHGDGVSLLCPCALDCAPLEAEPGTLPGFLFLSCYRDPRVVDRRVVLDEARREAPEERRPPLAPLVFVFLVAAFLVVVEVFLFGDLFFVAAFLAVVRAFATVFLDRVFRLAADADFVFCLDRLACFCLVKPEAAPPRAPNKAPATAPPSALPATPASSAVSMTLSCALEIMPSFLLAMKLLLSRPASIRPR